MSYKKTNGIVQVQGGTETHWTNNSANIPNGMLVHALDTGNIKLGNGEAPYVDCLTLLNSNNLKGAQKVFTNIPEPISGEDDGKVVIIQNGKFALATFSANNAVSLTDFETSLLEKADINHTHDDDYYTSLEVNEKVNEIKGLSKADQDIISYLTLKDAEKNVRSGVALSDSFMDEYNNLKYIDTTESNIDVSIPGEIHPNDGKTILTSTSLLEKSGDVPKVNIFLRGSKAKYINLNDVLEVSKDGINWYTTELTEISFLPEDDVTAYVGNVEFDKKLIVDNKQLRDDLGYEDLKGNITNISILNTGKANFDQPVMRDIIGSVVYLNNGVELCTILDIKNDGTNIDDVSITSAPIGNYTVSSIRKFYTNDKIESHNFSATLTDILFRRNYLNSVENDGLIYFTGGQEEDNTYHDSFYSYNPVTKEINELSSKLIRAGATLFSYKSKIIAMSYNTFTIYDTITDTWEDKVAPKYKYLLAGGIIGDDLYIYGGYTTGISGVTNDFWKCSLVDYTWTQLDDGPFPEGNIRAGSCVYENELYILGGTGGSSGYYTEFYKYNPVTENWLLIDNLPEGHEQNWLFNIFGIFYVFNITNNNIYKYDPSIKKWINVGESKTRNSFSMCQFGNSIYSLSGNNENRHSPEVWRYNFNNECEESNIEYIGTEELVVLPTSCPTNPTQDRYAHVAEILYGNLVVCGGQNNQLGFHEYDIENEQYLGALANMPYERTYASSAVVNQILYVFHGMYSVNSLVYKNVWSYDRKTNTWSDITPVVSPPARYRHTTVAIGGKIYMYGGTNGDTVFNDTWVFNTNTKAWTQLANGLSPSNLHAAAVIGNKMYIIGGTTKVSTTSTSETHNTIRIYNTDTNTWSEVSGIYDLMNMDAVTLNDKIYFGGGYGVTSSDYMDDIYEYDPATGKIIVVKKLDKGRAALTLSVKDNKIIVFGGRSKDNEFNTYPLVYDKVFVKEREINYGKMVQLTKRDLPKDCTISKVGDSLVCCGGRYNDSRKIGYLHKYHIPTKAWTKGTDIGPIIKHSSISNGTELFVFGGIDKEGNALNLFRKYNPITDTWTELAIGPSARYGTCMAINDDVIYLHAGYTNSGPAKDTWKYTISTNTWVQLSDSIVSRYKGSLNVLKNNLIVSGGKTNSGLLSDIYRYDLVDNTWISLADRPNTEPSKDFVIKNNILAINLKCGTIDKYDTTFDSWNKFNMVPIDIKQITQDNTDLYILDKDNGIHLYDLSDIPESDITNEDFFREITTIDNFVQSTAAINTNDKAIYLTDIERTAIVDPNAIIVGNDIYIGTGSNPMDDPVLISRFFKMDLTTFKITYLEDLPIPCYSTKMNYYDGKIYTFGGNRYTAQGTDSHNKLQIYDIATDTWEVENTPSISKYGMVQNILNGKLYILFGRNLGTTYTAEVWEYDIATKSWVQKNDCPEGPGYMMCSTTYDNKIYVAGGYIGGYKKLLSYDPNTDTWTRLADMLADNWWGDLVVLNNDIWLLNGHIGTESVDNDGNLIPYKYNVANNTWSAQPTYTGYMADKVFQSAVAIKDNVAYMYGGCFYAVDSNVGHANLMKFTPTNGLEEVSLRPNMVIRGGRIIYDNKLYLIGGYIELSTGERPYVEGMWVLDLITKEWSYVEIPGLRTAYREWIEFQGKFYGYIAGLGFYVLDPNSNELIELSNTDRMHYALTKDESYIYLSGGYEAVNYSDLWRFDVVAKVWTRLADMPGHTSWHKMECIGNKIYCIASWDVPNQTNMADFWEYDIPTDSWTIKQPRPIAYHSFASVVHNDEIYVIGGSPQTLEYIGPVSLKYDKTNDSWIRLNDFIYSGGNVQAQLYNNQIVIIPNIYIKYDAMPLIFDPYVVNESLPYISHTNKKKYFDIKDHTSCNINNDIYIYETNNLYRYNADTEYLVSLSPSPVSLRNAKSLIHDNKVYIYGGIDTNNNPSMVISIYDIASDTWSTATGPAENYGHSISKFNNLLISIGGNNGTVNHTNIYTYNLDTGNTNDYPVTDTDTLYGTSHIYNNELYYIGGKNQSGISNKMVIFKDLPIFQNKEVLETPFRLHKHGSCIIDNYLVVYGGIDENEKPSNKIYIFNLVTRTWNKYKTITEPRYGHCLLNIDNEPFVIGGVKYMNSSEPCFFKFDFMKKETSSIVLNNTDGWNIMNVKGNYLDDTYLFISTDIDTYSTYVNNTGVWKEIVKKIDGIWNYLTKNHIWMPADDIHQAAERAFNYLDEHEKNPVQQVTENMPDGILILEGTRNTITDINNRSVIPTNKQVVENTTLKYRINSEDGMTVHGVRLLAE